jgi:hypothetical protein
MIAGSQSAKRPIGRYCASSAAACSCVIRNPAAGWFSDGMSLLA